MTPYYKRDGIVIFCGEAGEVLSQLEPGSIDLTVTSPPYDRVDMDDAGNLITYCNGLRTYNGYSWDFATIAAQLWRVTKPGGVVVWVVGDATVNGSETCTPEIQKLYFRRLGFNVHDTMIYQKLSSPNAGSVNCYRHIFEFMFIFSKNEPKSINLIKDHINKSRGDYRAGRTKRKANGHTERFEWTVPEFSIRTNVWTIDSGFMRGTKDIDSYDHPAIFPEALARDHIISWSNPGDLVLDCFLGSGTTAKMAQHLGRRFVGCDVSEEYCRIAVDRLRQPSLFYSLPQPTKPEIKQEAMNL